MGWLSELSTVYDLVINDNTIDNKPLPMYHISNNVSLEITINEKSEFCSVKLLEEKERPTCMPCTEKSAARSSTTIAPYPFCDKLEYIAGDYVEYANGKNLEKKYKEYLALLEGWTQSKYSNPKITIVYNYVKKGTLIKDILNKGKILEMNTKSKIGEKKNNVFVRWNVEISGEHSQTWNDPEIQRLWKNYYTKICPNAQGLCYISGEIEPIANLHSKKIRNAGDGARIISSNDSSNYTYRGRFSESAQACQVGMAVSVKAHNALRWLIEKQGATIGNGLTIVAWCSAYDFQPKILKSTCDLWDNEEKYSTLEKSAKYIEKQLIGYYGKIKENDKIFIIALNSAVENKGRLAIILYREFIKSIFYDAQKYWHEHLAWFYTYKKEGKKKRVISAPSPLDIVMTAYGENVNDNAKTFAVKQLLSCIIDKKPIPTGIEQLCFSRASRINTLKVSGTKKTLENRKETLEYREKVLETACAVIKYNKYARNKEDYTVGLEEDRNDRDYLYGRLLAVADRVESRVLYQRKEERDTNAVRYMQRFARYPYSTWEILYVDKLQPYLSQLKEKRYWYESLIQEIKALFKHDDFVSEKSLSGEFLLGYHCQQKVFWDGIAQAKLKTSKQTEPNDEEEDN